MKRKHKESSAWIASMQVVEAIYHLTAAFPPSEQYGLSSQMRRAAVSVPSNIAEGYARSSTKELIQFISVALGSASELDTQLEIALRLGYVQGCEDLQTVLDGLTNDLVLLRSRLRQKVVRAR